MKRIAIFIHGGIAGGSFGQGQPNIRDWVLHLAAKYEVDAFVNDPTEGTIQHDHLNLRTAPIAFPWRWSRWLYLALSFLWRQRTKKYSLVYAFWGYPSGPIATALGSLLNISSIIHLQGGDAVRMDVPKYGVFAFPFVARLCRWAYRRCSTLIVLTEFQAACLKANGIAREPKVIPFGVDLSKFPFRTKILADKVVRFLHVGNLTPVKGQNMMLRVFHRVASVVPSELVVVGPDHYAGRLQSLCRELGIENSVQFVGAIPHEQLPRYYQQADIFLHTPLYEGQGLVFAEAAASGTLIAGTQVGMLADIGDECGLIVCPGQIEELAEKIINTIRDPVRTEAIRHAAYEKVRNYEVEKTYSLLLKEVDTATDFRSEIHPSIQ